MPSDFSTEDVVQMVLLLSRERLQPFRDLTASDIDAIELHQAAMRLNMALVAVTALTEIALRDSPVEPGNNFAVSSPHRNQSEHKMSTPLRRMKAISCS